MSELPNVNPGEVIASAHINDIKDRSVQRYTNDADRDTKNPTPDTGDLAYIDATGEIQVFNGTAWVMGGGGVSTGDLITDNGTATTSVIVKRDIGGVAGAAELVVTSDGGASTSLRNVRDGVVGHRLIQRDDATVIKDGAGNEVFSMSNIAGRIHVPTRTETVGVLADDLLLRNISLTNTTPTTGAEADGGLWINRTSKEISFWSGSAWTLIGTLN